MYDYCIILPEDEQNRVWSVAFLMKGGDAYVIRTSYLAFIYILFIELAIVTVVAIALFVALVVTIRKLDNEKNTSLLGR